MSDDDKLIDDILAGARAAPDRVPDALMARVLADASTELEMRAKPTPLPKPNGGRGILSWFGGWPGLAGLSTAAAAGVFIGFSAPQGVNSLAAVVDPTTATFLQLEPVAVSLTDFDEWNLEDG